MYARTVQGRTLNFAVSGKLWNRSLVMLDAETKSLWSHLLGECMEGELKGFILEAIPSDMVTWKAWHETYPSTTVLNMSRTSKDYSREFYTHPQQFVFGFLLDGKPYHCSFAVLRDTPIVQITDTRDPLVVTFDPASTSARLFSRRLDDRTLTFEMSSDDRIRDKETGSLWDRATGLSVSGPMAGRQLEARVGIVSYARAWLAFHPDSRAPNATD